MALTGKKIESRDIAALLSVLLVILVVEFFAAQRIMLPSDSRGRDYHWDGTYYMRYARSIDKMLFAREIDSYSLTRIFPSSLVHLGFRIVGKDFYALDQARMAGQRAGSEPILFGFVILNGIAIFLATLAWIDIARRMALDRFQLILGTVAFYVNFCFLKWNSFHPMGTDVTAFSLSMMMISRYLAQAPISLFFLSLCGAFTWPTLVFTGAILLALPPYRQLHTPAADAAVAGSHATALLWVSRGLALALAVLATVWAAQYGLRYTTWGRAGAALSFAIVGLYVCFASAPLLAALPDVRNIFVERRRYLVQAAIAAALLAVVGILFYLLASGKTARSSFMDFVRTTFIESVRLPGIFLIAHFAFFGPIVALVVLKWTAAGAIARRLGPGFIVAALVSVPVALMSESRQLMGNLAFFVIPVIAAVKVGTSERLFLVIFVLIALALSRVWVVFDLDALAYVVAEYRNYPWQWFFGAMGPRMTVNVYLVHVAAFFATLLLLYVVMRVGARSGAAHTDPKSEALEPPPPAAEHTASTDRRTATTT